MSLTSAFDPNPGLLPGATGPATRAVAVVPADNTDLPVVARSLYIGTPGDVVLVMREGFNGGTAQGAPAPVTFKSVPAGILHVWCRQVWATGTTAANIVALA